MTALNGSSHQRQFDEISHCCCSVSLSVYSWFTQSSHTSTPSASNFLSFSPLLPFFLRQGAEAPSDTAAQRSQVQDSRIHRFSEAQVWLLQTGVADAKHQAGEGGSVGWRVRRGGKGCTLLKASPQRWILKKKVDILSFYSEQLVLPNESEPGWAAIPFLKCEVINRACHV